MNQEQRAALRKLAEEATPGPWYCKHKNEVWSSIVLDEGSDCGFIDAWSSPIIEDVQCSAEQLSSYIAAANPSTILSMLDYIDALEKDAGRYRWLIEQHWIQSEVDWRMIPTDQESTIAQLDAAIDAAMQGEAE